MINAKDLLLEDSESTEEGDSIRFHTIRRDGRRILIVNGTEFDITDLPPTKRGNGSPNKEMLERLDKLRDEAKTSNKKSL